ncbi:acyl-CoA dehydrogenase family protein [Massilia sp. UMI-21]|nr:acyl-CoA dehydrogenase family protein [Massilia sp. UMI-21]
MDLSYSSEQIALQEAVRRFCDKNYNFLLRNKILQGSEGREPNHWKLFAELGWLGAGLPEDVGGSGGSAIEVSILTEAFGRALVVEPFIPCAVLAAQVVNAGASAEQRRDLLGPLVGGELMLAFAHGETQAGGRPQYVATRAVQRADGQYVLDGEKTVVLGGPFAEKFVVSARTAGDSGDRDGISLFLVSMDSAGITRKNYRLVDGTRASDLVLDQVVLPPYALLGQAGGAIDAIELAIDHAATAACAEACGAMDSVLWLTRDYLKTRNQYGATLNTYQALQHRMADMLVESEMSRSMLFNALNAMQQDDADARRKGVSASKVLIGQRGQFVGSNAIQLHGGMGVTEEYIIGHYFKRLVTIGAQFGHTDYHLERFGSFA